MATGGLLNELNGKMGISSPSKSVPVMKLIKEHKPQSKEELVELIKFHYENKCSCGIVSHGTVENFGKKLFESQIEYWGEQKFTLKQCIQWEYDLFVVNSLKGGILENKALEKLTNYLRYTGFLVTETFGSLDEELRIDLVITHEGIISSGVQVKPSTYLGMREGVKQMNIISNERWGNPVHYLYYDQDGRFENMSEVVHAIIKKANG